MQYNDDNYLTRLCGLLIRAPATVKHVSSPNPDWKPGDKQSPPFENKARLALDPDEQGASGMYPFTISSVIPRPIGFVASLSKEVSPCESC